MIVDDTNTHWGVIYRPARKGKPCSLKLIVQGPEAWCWTVLAAWTSKAPLRKGEVARVLVDTAVLSHAW